MSNVLTLSNIKRSYAQGDNSLEVLKDITFSIAAGEVVALLGASGSGKSTLLQIAGLLDLPSSGEVVVAGQNMSTANDAARTAARRNHIGFVYQFHHLLPEFSALENVALPQLIAGRSPQEANVKASELLASLGLSARVSHRPAKLSGGEQQRVAIARALANRPQLLLADEPTGNLDAHTADEVFALLMKTAKEHRIGALIATHNLELARRMDHVVQLKDGVLA